MTIQLVRDLMQIGVRTCPSHMPLAEAICSLLREGLESLVVLDEHGHATGLFGRREAVAAYGLSSSRLEELESLTVADVMRPDIPQIPPDIPATAAAQLMLDQDVRSLYLMHRDGGIQWPAAVLSFEDLLRHLIGEDEPSLALTYQHSLLQPKEVVLDATP